jgi:pimeloyl-ACP methyl ester carboxylesterase
MVFSFAGFASAEAEKSPEAGKPAVSGKITTCDENCKFFPTIIVPGLGQSSVCVTDDDGNFILDKNGNKVTAFPAYLQVDKIIKTAIFPALASLMLQRDAGLSDAFAQIIDDSFGINSCDLNAKVVTNTVTEKFPYPYSMCNEYELGIINTHVPFEKYPTELPRDHTYYFAYNSFGNHIDLANELYDFIQMVKEQTGHDKVNIVPLSQGASIFSAMLEYRPEVMDQIHKVMLVVPAIGGSIIIGDVFNGRVNFLNKDYLYNGFLEEMRLLDEHTARLIEVAVRILPDEVVMATLEKGVKHLVENVMIKSTGMWALCPPEDYPSAAERYLSSPEMANIKAQTDKYYQAQLHAHDNIQKLLDKGVQVFDVAEYNFPVINVPERWNQMNGDFIIHLDSTSLGAYSVNYGETLPDGYTQKNTHCSNPEHNHISPDRVVDASAGLLPDTTFYFDGQRHDLTAFNDVILKIAMHLIADEEIKDVYSLPEFPQFLSGRFVKDLLDLLDTVEEMKAAGKSNAEIDTAAAKAQSALDNNLAKGDEIAECEKELRAALAKVGAAEKAKEEKDPSFLRKISLWLYENYGTNGYSEMPGLTIKNLFEKIKGIFSR